MVEEIPGASEVVEIETIEEEVDKAEEVKMDQTPGVRDMNRTHRGTRVKPIGFMQMLLFNASLQLLVQ